MMWKRIPRKSNSTEILSWNEQKFEPSLADAATRSATIATSTTPPTKKRAMANVVTPSTPFSPTMAMATTTTTTTTTTTRTASTLTLTSMVPSFAPDTLKTLHDHDCLLVILSFLHWEDLNHFCLTSKHCYQARCHTSLDQTRTGTVAMGCGNSQRNAMDVLELCRSRKWCETFSGNRTHLRLSGISTLSPDIDGFTEDYLRRVLTPLTNVTSIDCSVLPSKNWESCHAGFTEDYVDKGFALGLLLALLAPNLYEVDMSCLPITLLGLAFLTESTPDLEILRWNSSSLWINDAVFGYTIKAFRNLKELYLDDSEIVICNSWDDPTLLWATLANHNQKMEKLSIKNTRCCHRNRTNHLQQKSLLTLVRRLPNLRWIRSDLTKKNIQILKKERPNVTFL